MSYVERSNLTMRMSMRRFTRLTNAIPKKIENHVHALAIYFVWYNWMRIHKTLRVAPAMEAGLTDTLMDWSDLIALIDADEKDALARRRNGLPMRVTAAAQRACAPPHTAIFGRRGTARKPELLPEKPLPLRLASSSASGGSMRATLSPCGVSCLALLAAVPALAGSIDAPSKIDAVTVFPDAAGITRIADIELPRGASTIVFKGLPLGVDPASLRLSGEGAARLTIGAVEQRIVPAGRPPPSTTASKPRSDR